MTHTPSPRTLSSATGDVQAKVAQRQRRSADQDLGFRIRNDLARALKFYPITAKHVAVLSGLISFLGEQTRVVFASNRKLSARLHHLPERTLSRQVKLLVEEGFLRRVMSPNGKRWARRTEDGGIEEAFGLDLTPFFDRAPEFAERAAESARREAEIEVARLRLSLLRERLEELGAASDLVGEIRRERRRVPCPATLERLKLEAEAAMADLGQSVDNSTQAASEPEEMASNDSQNGRHIQTRNNRIFYTDPPQPSHAADVGDEEMARELGGGLSQAVVDLGTVGIASERRTSEEAPSEPPSPDQLEAPCESVKEHADRILAGLRCKLIAQSKPSFHDPEVNKGRAGVDHSQPEKAQRRSDRGVETADEAGREPPRRSKARPSLHGALPDLTTVLDACPEALSLAGDRPRSWSQLFEAAWQIGRWFGIADTVLAEACAALGREGLAVTLFGLCERQASIRHPAAYLRSLCQRHGFNPAELLTHPRYLGSPGSSGPELTLVNFAKS